MKDFKDKTSFRFIFFALCIIPVILSVFIVTSCKEEPFSVENIILSKSLDANNNPTEESDSFKEGTKEIFLVLQIKNMKNTDNITVKWTYLDEDLEIDNKVFVPEKKFNGNKIFIIKIAQGFPFGNYEANVFINGIKFKTIPFKVK